MTYPKEIFFKLVVGGELCTLPIGRRSLDDVNRTNSFSNYFNCRIELQTGREKLDLPGCWQKI